jgi:ribose/xylose/arabinose/galactoside ABC-type transport system permease subunit
MKKSLAKKIAMSGPLIGLALVIVLFTVTCHMLDIPGFATFYNAKTILTQTVIVGTAALGMTFVVISGGIDLSVGSQVALCTVVTATLLNILGGSADTTSLGTVIPLLAALGGIGACALCGVANGLLVSKLKIVPFIVTLGMMQIARGVAKWVGNETTVMTPPNWLQDLMAVDPEPRWLVFAPGVWIMLVLLVAAAVSLRYTVFGRYTFAIGSNEQTARLCGVNVELRRILIYTLCGIMTGVAGVMQYGNLNVGDPTAAKGMELDIIAAVVIGGGSLNGGEGGALGTLVGALIMAVLRNGCNMVGIPNYVQDIIIGTIIIGAVAIDQLKHR